MSLASIFLLSNVANIINYTQISNSPAPFQIEGASASFVCANNQAFSSSLGVLGAGQFLLPPVLAPNLLFCSATFTFSDPEGESEDIPQNVIFGYIKNKYANDYSQIDRSFNII